MEKSLVNDSHDVGNGIDWLIQDAFCFGKDQIKQHSSTLKVHSEEYSMKKI